MQNKKATLVSVYLEMLECDVGMDDPKYGDEPDPLAHHVSISDRCMSIECPVERIKCLQLMKTLGLGKYDPEEF